MRDEGERGALLQVIHDAEQQLHFLLFENRGRLVEKNGDIALDAAVERQGLGDLHHLAAGEGEFGAARARMNIKMDFLQLFRRSRIHARFRDQAELQEFFLAAEEDVFSDGQRR